MNVRFYGVLLSLFFTSAIVADAIPKVIYHQNGEMMMKDKKMLIVFDEAVVEREQVGTPVSSDFLKTEPALQFEATWETPNIAAITVGEEPPFRSIYTWKADPSARYISGNALPEVLSQSHGKLFNDFSVETFSNRGRLPIVYIKAATPITADQFEKPVFTDNSNKETIPAKAISFTVAEAMELEKKNNSFYSQELKSWLQKNKGYAPEDTVPVVLGFIPESPLTIGHRYSVTIREQAPPAPFDKPKKGATVQILDINTFAINSGYVTNNGKRFILHTSVPIATKDIFDIFRDKITIWADGKEAVNTPNGLAKTVQLGDEEITFYLDSNKVVQPDEYGRSGGSFTSSIPIAIDGDTPFKCKVKAEGLVAIDGQYLSNERCGAEAEVRPDDPSVDLDAGNSIMLADGTHSFQIDYSMLENISVKAKKLPFSYAPQALAHYSRYYENAGDDRKDESVKQREMRLLPYDLLPYEFESPEVSIDTTAGKMALSFDELFSRRIAPGMYLVNTTGNAPENTLKAYKKFGGNGWDSFRFSDRDTVSCTAQALVQVTDLGMLWKRAGDTISVYAYRLSSGKALHNGNCQITNNNGQVLARGNIKDGLCKMEVPDNAGMLRLFSGNDSLTLSLDQGQISTWASDIVQPPYWMDESKEDLAKLPRRTVFMFTNRNLYKPGEQAHIKGIVRSLRGNDILADTDEYAQAVFSIQSPANGQTFAQQPVHISPEGTFDITVTFPDDVTGDYTATLYFPKNKKDKKAISFYDDASFNDLDYAQRQWEQTNREFTIDIPVHEFKHQSFEVAMDMAPLQPGATTVPVSATAINLTGIPASGAKVSWFLRSRPVNFYPKNLSDYEFGDYRNGDSDYWAHYYGRNDDWHSMSLSDTQTGAMDMEGKARAALCLSRGKQNRAQKLEASCFVTNGNNTTVFRSASTRIDPARVYVGLKRNSRLISTDSPLKLDLIAVGLDGKPYSRDLPVKIDVTRQIFTPTCYLSGENTTVKNEDEQFSVFSDETLIQAHPAHPEAILPKRVTIPANLPGIYTVTITGQDEEGHPFLTATKYWVYGDGRSPWLYRNGLGMTLVPDKTLYKAGDTAKILLQTPIEGDVVVMVERDRVMRTFRKRVTLTDSTVEVPLEEGDAPNVYASIFLVKGAIDSERIAGMPQLKLGYCCLKVDPEAYRLKVVCNTPKASVLPGSQQKISGVVTDSANQPVKGAEVTLFVEDEGILSILGYKNPMPLDHFYQTRILGVKTHSPLGRLLDENLTSRSFDNKGIFVGGGDALNMHSDHTDLLRRNFNPSAFWKADLVTDDKGSFQVSYTNPDTLTRYRVVAVAVQGARFGTGTSAYVVSKPVMAEPGTPMFASQGDELELTVELSKTSSRQGKWQVTLESANPSIARINTAPCTLTIPDKGTATASLPVTFTGTGEAALTWIVRPVDEQNKPLPETDAAGLSDRVESRFPVTFPAPLLRERHTFVLDQSTTWDPAGALTPELQQVKGSLNVELSSSPLVFTADSMRFLLNYPYGCLEQVSSAMVPWIYADVFSKYCPDFPTYTTAKRKNTLNKAVADLLTRQGSNGALPYWNSGESNCVFSPYAALVLMLVKDEGIPVPEQALKRLNKSLDNLPHVDAKPLAQWVRAKSKLLTEADFNKLLDSAGKTGSRSDMLLEILALSESPVGNHRSAATAMLDRLPTQEENTVCGNISPALELLARTALKPQGTDTLQCLDRLFQPYASGTRFNTTWKNAWDLIAIAHFLKDASPTQQDATVIWNGQTTGSPLTVPASGQAVNQSLPLPFTTPGSFTVSGEGKVFGHCLAQGKPTRIDFPGITDKGMTVLRKYEIIGKDGQWTPASRFVVGDTVRITLEVIPTDQGYRYVAIEDNMPSSFEAINPGLQQNPEAMPDGFSYPRETSNLQFFKDKVRFFVDDMPEGRSFRASYLARVVRAGQATVPPAKAELMYEPQVYGLSISERFTVTNKESSK